MLDERSDFRRQLNRLKEGSIVTPKTQSEGRQIGIEDSHQAPHDRTPNAAPKTEITYTGISGGLAFLIFSSVKLVD
jgi:hypothetical protein